MTNQKVINLSDLYTPHPHQALVHASKARVKVLKWGRRSGKGRCAVWDLIKTYTEMMSEDRPATLVPRIQIWVIAPTFPQSFQCWQEIIEFTPPELIVRMREVDHTIWLQGGGLLQVKSADNPNSLQNVGLDYVWITEAASIYNDTMWYNQVMPMLRSPGRSGKAIIESRPTLIDSWFETLFGLGQPGLDKDPEYESWHATVFDNPEVNVEEIERDRLNMPESTFQQEYLANTQADEQAAFPNVTGCIGGEPEEWRYGNNYVMGVDLGSAQDFTPIIVMDKDRRKVVFFERGGRLGWIGHKERIKVVYEKYAQPQIIMDSTGVGDVIYDDLRAQGLRIKPINLTGSKIQLMLDLFLSFEKEWIKIPSEFTTLIKECRRFRRYRPSGGQEKWSAPGREHDDCVISLALANSRCLTRPVEPLSGGIPDTHYTVPPYGGTMRTPVDTTRGYAIGYRRN